ncbi:MAG: tetratricopeptide repeat protein [Terracidiphilus sp.]
MGQGTTVKTEKTALQIYSVVDPASPWNLPSLFRGFPNYPGKMSAIEWKNLLAKAKGGDAEAEWNVAQHYSDGCNDRRGRVLVRISNRKAAEWYRRSAEHGYVIAQNTLGVVLGGSYGVKKNAREALLWLKRAFRGGDTISAANNVAVTYRENGNLRQAVRWFREVDVSRDDSVLIQLGVHSYWGKGVRTDHRAAVCYFRKAVRGKNLSECDRDDANFFLGIAYLEGNGVRKSPRMAQKHFERANRDNDHLAAQRLLKQLGRVV